MSTPIIDIDTPAAPTSVPVDDAAWDAAASASTDTLPDLPTDTGTGNGKFCEICGNPLHGRQRRFCDDHARGTSVGPATNTGKRTTRRGGWKDGARVEENLSDLITTIAGGLMFTPKTSPAYKDGEALYKFGPRIAHELVILANDDARLRKVLERLAAPGKYGPLVIVTGGLVLTVAANHGLLPPAVADAINAVTPDSTPTGGEL